MSETIVLEKDRTMDRSIESRWDGANYSAVKFDVECQDGLLKRGGRAYLRFYTGDYGFDHFEKFLRSVFKEAWDHPKLGDASFDEPNAEGSVVYPLRYLEFVETFIGGAVHISHEKRSYSGRQMRKFMSEGDRCLFGHLCNMTQGASAPRIIVHSMHGRAGSAIRPKPFKNFLSQAESSTVNFERSHGALHHHPETLGPFSVHLDGKDPTLDQKLRCHSVRYGSATQ